MKKRSISLIIGLMSLALLGVMAMQLYFLRESYQLKTQLFNQAVNESLSNVVAKMEKQDAYNFIDSKEKQQRNIIRHSAPRFVKFKNRSTEIPEEPIEPKEEHLIASTMLPNPAVQSAKRTFVFNSSRGSQPTFAEKSVSFKRDTNLNIEQLTGRPLRMRLATTVAAAVNSENIQRTRPASNVRINDERYARLLEAEQSKADKLFEKRDSLFRLTHPVAFAYKNVLPDPNENPLVDLRMDVVEYADEFGRLQQVAKLNVVPKETVIVRSMTPKRQARRDTIVQYVVMDPQAGPQLFTKTKPRILQVDPQILEEDAARQLKEASRVSKFVKKYETKNALQALVTEFQHVNVPLKERIKFSLLDSLLKSEFKSHGIDIPFQYKVLAPKKDSVIFSKASTKEEFIAENTYQTKLFPKDLLSAGLLTVTFPDKISILSSNMPVLMGSSAGLLLVLLFCFGYTIHIILRQKKVSEMKTDFINNMTHEFKTPVATIMIASEALKDPEVTEDQTRIKRLAGIIYDENVRLGSHIERVLNIAKIDRDDLRLENTPVDMNELVAAITDSMSLQLQKKEATVNLDLKATKPVVHGDELHLSNVIFNLIDNAIKYSTEKPVVDISTYNVGKNLVVKVSDKGIGMSRDQLGKIFEQFYRIPTGNLHDVKGFGLGLSYVNNIVKRLGGSIKVKSEKDRGSEFEIILPAHLA